MSEEKKPDRPSSRSVRRPAAEAPADEAPVNSEGGGDEPAPTPKAAKGPVAVGRSLEISLAPDVCMDMLIDKLKLLDYEKEFCRRKKPYRKPLTRLYFAYALPSGNQAEQFFYFTGLMSWLLGQAGVEFKEPKEFDDPNMSCNNLITSIKKLGFAAPTYPAMKLTTGYGKEVCGVVDGVVDYVLERRNYSYRKPVYLPDGYVEEAGEGGDDDDGMDAIDEFKLPEFPKDDLDDDDAYMDLGGVAPAGKAGAKAGDPQAVLDPADKAMLTSKVDPTLWKLELERVGPKLRILLNADAKDWRTNLEEVQNNSKAISSAWPDSRTVLEKLRGELNTSLEKLTTREKFLNEQFDRLMQQYRAQRSQLQDIQGTYNKHTEAISDRNNELHRISEQLTEMKTMMEERGSNISDATPVVRMKGAIKKLSDELHEMEVRIGVVSHTLLQLSLKNRRLMHAQAAVMSDEDDI